MTGIRALFSTHASVYALCCLWSQTTSNTTTLGCVPGAVLRDDNTKLLQYDRVQKKSYGDSYAKDPV